MGFSLSGAFSAPEKRFEYKLAEKQKNGKGR
jgi:hypothetical protein